jgi:signal transduction histidine kinase
MSSTEKQELQYLLAWERLRRRIAELATQEKVLTTTYQVCAEEVGQFFNADRCIVISYNPVEPDANTVHGWVSGQYSVAGVRKILDEEMLEPFYPDFMLQIMKTRMISISSPEELRQRIRETVAETDMSPQEQEDCFQQISNVFANVYCAQAVLRVAILYQGISFGSLVLHQCTPRQWNETEQEALKDIAYHIGSVLYQTRLRVQEQLSRKKLEKRNLELEQLITITSHDLREPIRKISLYSDRLQLSDRNNLTDKGRHDIDSIQKFSAYMQSQLNALLDLLKVTRKTEAFEPVPLNDVLQSVLTDLEADRQKQNGTIVVTQDQLVIDSVSSHLYLLFWNLLHNALKFHRQGEAPHVELGIRSVEPDACRITVRDDGIGFDEVYLDRIFTPFERLHSQAEYEGTGMGLAIAEKVVEFHNGSISARSAPGQGATFTVTLPVHQS